MTRKPILKLKRLSNYAVVEPGEELILRNGQLGVYVGPSETKRGHAVVQLENGKKLTLRNYETQTYWGQ